jgi:hypothetical protein
LGGGERQRRPTHIDVLAARRVATRSPVRMAWQFDYRIDWDAPVVGTPDRARAPYSRHSPGAAGGAA